MKRFYACKSNFNNNKITLSHSEHNHLKNVLRLKEGDQVICVMGDCYDYFCNILSIEKQHTILFVYDKKPNTANPKEKVTVFQALIKKDNMYLVTQKLNELGVLNLCPFESEYITAKDKNTKQIKLQEIAFQSSKQCGRSMPMIVSETLSFKSLLAQLSDFDAVLFANEKEKETKASTFYKSIKSEQNIAIIIGSEGGFSDREVASLLDFKNVVSVSLGTRILRSETASIATSACVMNALA